MKTPATQDYVAFLAEQIYSSAELSMLVESIRQAVQEANRGAEDPFLDLPAKDQTVLSQLWLNHQSEYKNIQDFLHNLEIIISQIKLSTIYLSYRPDSDQTMEICQLLRSKLKATMFLKVEHRPQLTAGFMLEHLGKRYDYTLSKLTKLHGQ